MVLFVNAGYICICTYIYYAYLHTNSPDATEIELEQMSDIVRSLQSAAASQC